MSYCLACHRELETNETNYHTQCLAGFWQSDTPVLKLDYKLTEIEELAKENVIQRVVITGVQPKLSLGFTQEDDKKRLTIVGALNGRYILKPPYEPYPQMPEVEALSMLMAKACGVPTVPFLLVPLLDGNLAYLTRRIDRNNVGEKFPMEDACQFTERLTEHKYRGSYEQIVKGIIAYSQNPIFDIVRFYEQVIVSFLIGNNDMHLKNFSLISQKENHYTLAPAYDMISAQLLLPDDFEELALNLNGKKRKISQNDFDIAMTNAHIPEKAIKNLWNRIEQGMQQWVVLIENSFLGDGQKERFVDLIDQKASQLNINFNDL